MTRNKGAFKKKEALERYVGRPIYPTVPRITFTKLSLLLYLIVHELGTDHLLYVHRLGSPEPKMVKTPWPHPL